MRAYLDNAATTRLHPDVAEAMAQVPFGNPSSLHAVGREARQFLDEARTSVAGQLGAAPNEIIFTGGATEADNLALIGVARANRDRGRHIVTTAIEHSAVLGAARQLEREGFEVTFLPVDARGRIDLDRLREALRPDTALVSVMLGNNEVGTIQPIAAISAMLRPVGVLLHSDAAQACGKRRLSVDALGVDLLTLSGHKMHGPRGVGVLYKRASVRMEPMLHGGAHEHGLRSGTENVAAAYGFAHALRIAHRDLDKNVHRMEAQRATLLEALTARVPGLRVNGCETDRLPSILSVSFPGLEGDAIVLALDAVGVESSSGSACDASSVEPSHVLLAQGLDAAFVRGTLRLSVAADTSPMEIDHGVAVIPSTLARLLDARTSDR